MSQASTPGPISPSPSFLDASSVIDDLTRSLTDYSRVSTPEPPTHAQGCSCNTNDSEYTKAWMAVKTKLENRLVLSAGALHTALAHTCQWPMPDHAQRLGKPCYGGMTHMSGEDRFDPSPYFLTQPRILLA